VIRSRHLALAAFTAVGIVGALGPRAVFPQDSAAQGGIVTLYAHDDLLSTFSIHTGGAGAQIVEGEVRLDDAQLAFDLFAEDMFSFGFISDELVNVVDLGPQVVEPHRRGQDIAPKFPVSLFHTLYLDGAKFSYAGPGGTLLRHSPAERILDPMPRHGMYHVQPVVGNTYLLRSNRSGGSSRADELVKFVVVDFQPGHSVTLRWAPLRML
jgi:hypothetical protein